MNSKELGVGLNQSIELLIKHYRYWFDYESSVVLVDPTGFIIWFWDNQSENIDSIMCDLPYDWEIIVANWEKISYPLTKYKPYWVNKRTANYKTATKAEQTRLLQEYKDYNINYFTNLLKLKWN
jgi:hypothetical protein